MSKYGNVSGPSASNNPNLRSTGRSKFVSRNLNDVTKAPPSNQSRGTEKRIGRLGGGLLLLGKKTAEGAGVPAAVSAAPSGRAVVATPAPLNTASLRRENHGNDVGVNLVGRGTTGGTGWGNKVPQPDSKDGESQDEKTQGKEGIWKGSDTERKERPSFHRKRSEKWGDEDDSPSALDNEQFPGLQDSLKKNQGPPEKEQLRPLRGGREGEEGYRSWKREGPREMEPGAETPHEGGHWRPSSYAPIYNERGSYDAPGYHDRQYGDQYGDTYSMGSERPPPSYPPERYSAPPPSGGRYDYPYEQQPPRNYEWRNYSQPPPQYSSTPVYGGGGRGGGAYDRGGYEHDRRGPASGTQTMDRDRAENGFAPPGREPFRDYRFQNYPPRIRDWKQGGEPDPRAAPYRGPSSYENRPQPSWRDRATPAERGPGAGDPVMQGSSSPYIPGPRFAVPGGGFSGDVARPRGSTSDQHPSARMPPAVPPSALKDDVDLEKAAMQAALRARQEREEAERQAAEKTAVLKARERRLEEERRISVRSLEDQLQSEEEGHVVDPLLERLPDEDQKSYMCRLAALKARLRREEDERCERERKEAARKKFEELEAKSKAKGSTDRSQTQTKQEKLEESSSNEQKAEERTEDTNQLPSPQHDTVQLLMSDGEAVQSLPPPLTTPLHDPFTGTPFIMFGSILPSPRKHMGDEPEQDSPVHSDMPSAQANGAKPNSSHTSPSLTSQPSAPASRSPQPAPTKSILPTSRAQAPSPSFFNPTRSFSSLFGAAQSASPVMNEKAAASKQYQQEDRHFQFSADSFPTPPMANSTQPLQPPPAPSGPRQLYDYRSNKMIEVKGQAGRRQSGRETEDDGDSNQKTPGSDVPLPQRAPRAAPSSIMGAQKPGSSDSPKSRQNGSAGGARKENMNRQKKELNGREPRQSGEETGKRRKDRELKRAANDKSAMMISIDERKKAAAAAREKQNLEEAQQRKEARAKERAERKGPRTRGVLYKYVEDGLIVNADFPLEEQLAELRRKREVDLKREKENAKKAELKRAAQAEARIKAEANARATAEAEAAKERAKLKEARRERKKAKRFGVSDDMDSETEDSPRPRRRKGVSLVVDEPAPLVSGVVVIDEQMGIDHSIPYQDNSDLLDSAQDGEQDSERNGNSSSNGATTRFVFTEVKSIRTKRLERKEAKEKEEKEAQKKALAEEQEAKRKKKREEAEKAKAALEEKKRIAKAEKMAEQRRKQQDQEEKQRQEREKAAQLEKRALEEQRVAVPPALAALAHLGTSPSPASQDSDPGDTRNSPETREPTPLSASLGATIGQFLGGFGTGSGGFSSATPGVASNLSPDSQGKSTLFSEAVARPPSRAGFDDLKNHEDSKDDEMCGSSIVGSPLRSGDSGTAGNTQSRGPRNAVMSSTSKPFLSNERPGTVPVQPQAQFKPGFGVYNLGSSVQPRPQVTSGLAQFLSKPPPVSSSSPPILSQQAQQTVFKIQQLLKASEAAKGTALSPGTPSFLPSGSSMYAPGPFQTTSQVKPFLPPNLQLPTQGVPPSTMQVSASQQGQLTPHAFGSVTAGGLFIPGLSLQQSSPLVTGMTGTTPGLQFSLQASNLSHLSSSFRGIPMTNWNNSTVLQQPQQTPALQQPASKVSSLSMPRMVGTSALSHSQSQLAAGLLSEWTPQQGFRQTPAPAVGVASKVSGVNNIPGSHNLNLGLLGMGNLGLPERHQWNVMQMLQAANNPRLQQSSATGIDGTELQNIQAQALAFLAATQTQGALAAQASSHARRTSAGTGLYGNSIDTSMGYQPSLHTAYSTLHENQSGLFIPNNEPTATPNWNLPFAPNALASGMANYYAMGAEGAPPLALPPNNRTPITSSFQAQAPRPQKWEENKASPLYTKEPAGGITGGLKSAPTTTLTRLPPPFTPSGLQSQPKNQQNRGSSPSQPQSQPPSNTLTQFGTNTQAWPSLGFQNAQSTASQLEQKPTKGIEMKQEAEAKATPKLKTNSQQFKSAAPERGRVNRMPPSDPPRRAKEDWKQRGGENQAHAKSTDSRQQKASPVPRNNSVHKKQEVKQVYVAKKVQKDASTSPTATASPPVNQNQQNL